MSKCIKCDSEQYNTECPLCEAVRLVVEEKTFDDKSAAIVMTEAVIKSIKERLQRRTRKNPKPMEPTPHLKGVVKKSGDNNPIQGRAEFASGTVAKEQQNEDQRKRQASLRRRMVESYMRIAKHLDDVRVCSLLNEVCATGQGHADREVVDKAGDVIDHLQIEDGIVTYKDNELNWNQENATKWRQLTCQDKRPPKDR